MEFCIGIFSNKADGSFTSGSAKKLSGNRNENEREEKMDVVAGFIGSKENREQGTPPSHNLFLLLTKQIVTLRVSSILLLYFPIHYFPEGVSVNYVTKTEKLQRKHLA